MLDDPNKIDGHSRAEVYQLLREGQARVDEWRKQPAIGARAPAVSDFAALEAWLYPPVGAARA